MRGTSPRARRGCGPHVGTAPEAGASTGAKREQATPRRGLVPHSRGRAERPLNALSSGRPLGSLAAAPKTSRLPVALPRSCFRGPRLCTRGQTPPWPSPLEESLDPPTVGAPAAHRTPPCSPPQRTTLFLQGFSEGLGLTTHGFIPRAWAHGAARTPAYGNRGPRAR